MGALGEQTVDAIMRPVRADMAPVSAVSRDLTLAAGAVLADRLERMGAVPVGGAVLTPAGELAASFLIHVVVMSQDEAQSDGTVRRAVPNGLRRAADWELASVALPPLGVGVGNVEPETACRALVEVLYDHLDAGAPPGELCIVVSSEYEQGLFETAVADAARARGIPTD